MDSASWRHLPWPLEASDDLVVCAEARKCAGVLGECGPMLLAAVQPGCATTTDA